MDKLSEILSKIIAFIKGLTSDFPNITKSVILHLLVILLISGFLPTCTKKIEKPKTIAIDIMPMGEQQKQNTKPPAPKKQVKKEVKKDPPKPPEKKKEVKKDPPKKKEKPKEKPPKKVKPAPKPAPKKIEKEKEKPKEKPKPEEVKKQDEGEDQEGVKKLLKDLEKKEAVEEQQQLDNLFEDLDEKLVNEQQQNTGTADPTIDAAFVNEIRGKVQSQISDSWNIPIGAKDIDNIQVVLLISLAPDGAVLKVDIVNKLLYSTDNVYRVVADSAVWAVKEASPLQGLPAEKHNIWKEIEFTFDPSQML